MGRKSREKAKKRVEEAKTREEEGKKERVEKAKRREEKKARAKQKEEEVEANWAVDRATALPEVWASSPSTPPLSSGSKNSFFTGLTPSVKTL
jgi:hypothetical protein